MRESENVLDNTAVHPESYAAAEIAARAVRLRTSMDVETGSSAGCRKRVPRKLACRRL